MDSSTTKRVVAGAVVAGLQAAAAKSNNHLQRQDIHAVEREVTEAVAPIVQHATNTEPWYQSRVTWGAIIAVAGGIAGIAGYSVDVDDQAQIVNGIVGITTAIGGLIAWYGRWRAKKPLGR